MATGDGKVRYVLPISYMRITMNPQDIAVLIFFLMILSSIGCGPGEKRHGEGDAETRPATRAPVTNNQEHAPATAPAETEPPTKNATTRTAAPDGTPLVELDLGLGEDAVTRATPGYTKGITPPHLRKEIKRPPFMIPAGAENIALFKPVTCSDAEPVTGILEQITDGLKKSGPFHFVELGPGPRWVQVDLEETKTIYAVALWHYYKNPAIYNDVIVRIADDPSFKKNTTMLFNNDHDDSTGLGTGQDTAYYSRWWGEIVDARGPDFTGTTARYVRVYTADGMEDEPPRFVEIAVYGK